MAEEASLPGSPHYYKDPEKYHNQCTSIITEAINNNPFLRILMDSMRSHGCDVTPEFFKCRACPIKVGGFYDSKLGIVLCENQVQLKTTVEDVLMHEMVHAYDVCRTELDPSDCLQVACTEIRAANLSGECNWGRELSRGQFAIQKQYPACVRRRAEATMLNNPNCSKRAADYVDAAWRSCYRDTSPLGFVPLVVVTSI